MAVRIDVDACIGCGACTGVCPNGALSLNADQKSECDESLCISCGTCAATCPMSAITVE